MEQIKRRASRAREAKAIQHGASFCKKNPTHFTFPPPYRTHGGSVASITAKSKQSNHGCISLAQSSFSFFPKMGQLQDGLIGVGLGKKSATLKYFCLHGKPSSQGHKTKEPTFTRAPDVINFAFNPAGKFPPWF